MPSQGYKGQADASPVLLSLFEYALEGAGAQTFPVNQLVRSLCHTAGCAWL